MRQEKSSEETADYELKSFVSDDYRKRGLHYGIKGNQISPIVKADDVCINLLCLILT